MLVHDLIGKGPSADALAHFVGPVDPDIKSYSDVVYFNYASLGVSLQFSPQNGYRPGAGLRREQLIDDDLRLDAVDVYNVPPRLPLELHLGSDVITVTRDTTGREFVEWLGEPSRKGGGSGSIYIWCEWSQKGLMVEFGGSDARGPQAWERGGNAVWSVVTVFEPEAV